MSETRSLEEAVADLVPRAQRGDAGALDALLRACRDTIYRWALVQTADAEDAEDVLQETFLKAFEHLGDFHGQSKFYTWIVRIAVNESLM